MSRRPLAVLLIGCLVSSGVLAQEVTAPAGGLVEVPRPSLDHFEGAARDTLLEKRSALEALVAGGAGPEEQAGAYGDLGRAYYVHDLTEAAASCFLNALHWQPDDYRWHYFLGVIHKNYGELEEAAARFEQTLAIRPEDIPARVRLGRSLLEVGNLEAAAESFNAVLEQAPESAAAIYGLGQVAYERADYDTAIALFESALEKQPTATRIHYLLGLAYRETGDREAAIEQLKLNRDDPVLFDDPLVRELFVFVESAKLHFDSAMSLLEENEFERAIEQLRMAVEIAPDNFLYHHNLGTALVAADRLEEGAEQFRTALELNPDFRNAHFNLGAVLARLDRFEEAAGYFGRAHELDPNDALTHLEWATSLSKIGDVERAAEALEQLVEVNPDYADALLNLGIARAQLGRLDEAAEVLDRLVAGQAEDLLKAEAYFRLGTISEQRGERALAIDQLRESLDLDRTSTEAHSALAHTLGRDRRFEEAAFHFQMITRLDADDLGAHFGQALSLVLAEQPVQARAELEKSLEAHPGELALTHLLARLLATAPDPSVRDGARALVLAEEAFSRQQTLEHAETLAMAYAELGRFAEAVDWQRQVVSRAEGSASGALSSIRRRLDLYLRGEPCRAPWRDG